MVAVLQNARKLSGTGNGYRLRVRRWRISFTANKATRTFAKKPVLSCAVSASRLVAKKNGALMRVRSVARAYWPGRARTWLDIRRLVEASPGSADWAKSVTWLSIRVDLIEGRGERWWPRPGLKGGKSRSGSCTPWRALP